MPVRLAFHFTVVDVITSLIIYCYYLYKTQNSLSTFKTSTMSIICQYLYKTA